MKKNIIPTTIAALALALVVVVLLWPRFSSIPPGGGGACTMEAKLCPDGISYVGRTGPNCEFAACPALVDKYKDWKVSTDEKQGITFKYPDSLGTEFVLPNDWPPIITISSGALTCEEGESITDDGIPSSVVKKVIGDRTYCLESGGEGAAGSVYIYSSYATTKSNKLITVDFTLRYPRCENYIEPNKSNCLKEQKDIDLDGVVDGIAETMSFE